MAHTIFTAMQGDAYPIPFLLAQEDVLITPSEVKDVEISIGKLVRAYSKGEVEYHENGEWVVMLTQEETFAMRAAIVPCQVRIKFTDDTVIGEDVGNVCIEASISKEVL